MDDALVGRKRLTREESRAQTRERLLEAAYVIFGRDGVEAAAIEDVAEAAGYSRGAFYSNFESKDDLLCALLEREIERARGDVESILSNGPTPDELVRKVRQYYVELAGNEQDCMFWLAVQLYALRNPAIRPRVVELVRKDQAQVVEQVRTVYAALGKEPPNSAEIVAFGLIAIAQGLGISRMLDPEAITPELLPRALQTLFDRVAGLG